ncbi:MAG: iron-containing alcohol dehydrogenase [Lachnospiraceae bacterium]
MHNFIQYTPTKILFGKGVEQEVGKEVKKCGGNKVLIVYGGGSVVRSGLLKTVEEKLTEEGITYEEWGGAKPNPLLSFAEEGIRRGIAFHADFILAIGGGSAIDTAKGIAHGMANPDAKLWDIWTGKVPLTHSTNVGVVLTISAAGSETSDSAVLTNESIGKKAGINTEFNRPKFAIMNPEFTYSVSKYQLTCGIVDIMMHTLERYFTQVQGNQLTDEIAEGLLRTVIANGTKAYQNQEDYDCMSEIMWCGSLSHNGLTGLGRKAPFPLHKMGHELSAKFDVAHGASLAALWGAWAMYSYPEDIERFCRFGEKVWGITGENKECKAVTAIEKTVDYFRSLHMPVCLGDLEIGVQPEGVLQEMAVKALGGKEGTMTQFKEYHFDDIYGIYKKANYCS